MSEEPSNSQKEQTWVKLADMECSLVEHILPIERDEGGKVEGYRGTYFNHELQRIEHTWRGENSWQDRKLGVGRKVLIKAGTPIQMWFPLGVRGWHYVATESITGTLKKETEKRLQKYYGGTLNMEPLEWIEMVKPTFEVSVDLPPATDPKIAKLLGGRIDVHVPNDMLELVEEHSSTDGTR